MTKGLNLFDEVAGIDKRKKVIADYDLRVLATKVGLKGHIKPDTAAMTKQEEPVTGTPELRESPDQGVLLDPDNWRRTPQRLLQHNDVMENYSHISRRSRSCLLRNHHSKSTFLRSSP